WFMTLPLSAEQRREKLAYLESLPLDPVQSREALAFAKALLIKPKDNRQRLTRDDFLVVSREEREQQLNALTRKELVASDQRIIPRYMLPLNLKDREEIRSKVLTFVMTLLEPGASDPSAKREPFTPFEILTIFAHLDGQAMIPLSVHDPRDP